MIEYAVKGAIVDSTSDSKHGIAIFFDPPGSGAFHAMMTDTFVGAFDGPAADGEAIFEI